MKYDKSMADAMDTAATFYRLLNDKSVSKDRNFQGWLEYARGAIEAGDVPESDKKAFLEKYGDGKTKSSSTRDQVVSKVKKAKKK